MASSGLPLSLKDVASIALSHRWKLALPIALLSLATIALAVLLPPTYRSQATILIESPKIPQELIRSTISTLSNERIEYISQRVLTSHRVLPVIRKFGLYKEELAVSTNKAVEAFRSNMEIEQIGATVGNRRTATISFSVAFSADSPETAQKVANELITMYLDENVISRSESAEQTTVFLAEEGEKIRATITQLEQAIAEFKQKNSSKMPDVVDMNLKLMQRHETDYEKASLELEETNSLLKVLERQKAQYYNASSGGVSNLLELKRQYNDFLVRNTESHPDALRMRRQIQNLEKQTADAETVLGANIGSAEIDDQLLKNPGFANLAAEIEAAQRKIRYFANSRRQLSKQLTELEARILDAPVVEQEYLDLQRDLENLDQKYQEIRNKELEAQISQNLEEDQKGESFKLLEPAGLPSSPESPNRLLILIGGLIFAFGSGLALVMLAELLNPGIRSLTTFAKLMKTAPLITIPLFDEDLEPPAYVTGSFVNLPFAIIGASCLLVLTMGGIHILAAPLETLVSLDSLLGAL